jgi:RHS repeat-associated protein
VVTLFQWQMAQGTTNFGDPTPAAQVQINGTNNAAFVSQSVPTTMSAGQAYSVNVTMQNTGTNTWSAANNYRLGTQNPQDNTLWTGATRVMLPAGVNVAPGSNATFSFTVTAPATPGTYNFQWKMLRELVEWFGPLTANVAVNVQPALQEAKLHFIHADHLNTPRLVANQSGQTVWRWDQQEPFGVNPADENPSGLGAFDLPLRLPGQYFDRETNLHYNYFRDYDPVLGRYEESDLIGLEAGSNTYTYVRGSPVRFTDPLGLREVDPSTILGGGGGGGPIAGGGFSVPGGNPLGGLPGIVGPPNFIVPGQTPGSVPTGEELLVGAGIMVGSYALAAAAVPVVLSAPSMCVAVGRTLAIKDPCKNPIIAATLFTAMCRGEAPDEFLTDLQRRQTIKTQSGQIQRSRINVQQSR